MPNPRPEHDPSLVDTRLGGSTRYYLIPRKEAGMRVPDAILKCAVFLGREEGTERVYRATAFVYALGSDRVPNGTFYYLVTAAHVANDLAGAPFWVRANIRDGGFREFEGDGSEWVRHDDKAVDAAVYPWYKPPEVDCIPIATSNMLTEDKRRTLNIGIGDDVLMVGLFAKHSGSRENLPLVRTGTLAMLPGEPIRNGDGFLWAHLIEARSIGGLSGSPVFVSRTMFFPSFEKALEDEGAGFVHGRVAGPIHFLGLMHGHWEIDPSRINDPVTHTTSPADVGVNVGIALVVPSEKILEIFNQPRLVEMRKKTEDHAISEQGTTTPDSGFQPKKRPGPEPERLVIDDTWERAVKRGLEKKPPQKKKRR